MAQAPKGRFILVRHGETDANRRRCFADSDDVPLSEAGLLQARELALLLSRRFRAEVLISSGLLRARQTSAIIARVLDLAAEALPGIHERDFGCLKGHPYERMGEMMTLAGCDASLWKPDDGESLDEVRCRVMEALESLRVRFPGREIVVVCHGAVIQAVCAHITGIWSEASVPPNCGIVTINYAGDIWEQPVLSGDWDRITVSGSSPAPSAG